MILREQKARKRVAARLAKALSASGLTQKEFATSISESRTTISHIVNAMKPGTKNPVHKSLKIINRVNRKLATMDTTPSVVESLRIAVDQAHADYVTAIGRYTEAVARSCMTPRTAKPALPDDSQLCLPGSDVSPRKKLRKKLKVERSRKPAVGHVWRARDPRRTQIVRLTAIHASHISYENVSTKRKGRYAAASFEKKFEFFNQAGS